MSTSRLLFAFLLGNISKADIRLALRGDQRTRAEALERLRDGIEHTVLDDAISSLDTVPSSETPWMNALPLPPDSIKGVTHRATATAEPYEAAPPAAAPDSATIAELKAGQHKLTQSLTALLEHLKGQ